MRKFKFVLIFALIYAIDGLPMKEKAPHVANTHHESTQGPGEDWEINLEYGRYLKEVVQALESDPEFRKKLETANVEDIKSGKIARELPYVEHHVRTKLDELKRGELERLRHLAMQENEKKHGIDRSRLKIPVHVDHKNPTKFESEDLRKLILQLNVDLEKIDLERQGDFKKYEMEKEYEYKEDLKKLDEDKRKDAEQTHQEQKKKHMDHPKLHHPGSKQQLEEVWEEQDHMKSEDFDPSTFFHLHDLDGNKYWDEDEVKSLFQKELDKMYDPNAAEDDQRERQEEMERMREHVFKETDTNHDNLISYEEFVVQTRKTEFERDDGWEGLDEQELYNQQEYEKYEHERQEEIRRLIEAGEIEAPPGYYMAPPPPIAHPNMPPPGMNNVPMAGGDYHNMIPPQGYQQVPQAYQQVPQGYQQMPQGQIAEGYHPELASNHISNMPPVQGANNQPQKSVPVAHNAALSPDQQQYQQQQPPQQYQVPQQQYQPQGNQIPQQQQFQQPPPQQYQQQQIPQQYQQQQANPQQYQQQQPNPQQFQQPNSQQQQPNAQQQEPKQQQPNAQQQKPNKQHQQPNAQQQKPNKQYQPPQGPNPPSKQNALAHENLGKPNEPISNKILK